MSPRSLTLPNEIEVVHPAHARGAFRFVLFDFDGTLSLIREGWQDVMVPMMVEILSTLGTGESKADLDACVREYVERLTGKQTIYQMMALCEEITRRGGNAEEPVVYKQMYHDRLWQRIKGRVAQLKDGSLPREAMMVSGSEELLANLQARGLQLLLASGTDDCYVQDEARALGIDHYFAGIYGAQDDYLTFSKKKVIERIFAEHGLQGSELLAFGDGYVEIENTKEVGGVAVGVASDEVGRVHIDPWKRRRLMQAGADIIIPHYRQQAALLDYLCECEA